MFERMAAWLSERPVGGWAWSWFLLAGGFACHGIIMATNLLQGLHMGADDQSALIFGAAALAIDLCGVGVASLLAGSAKRRGDKVAKRKYTAIAFASATVSLVMFFGYNATQRIEPAKQEAQRYQNEMTAQANAQLMQKEARNKAVEFASAKAAEFAEKAADRRLSKSERDAFDAQSRQWLDKAMSGAFAEVKVSAAPVEKTTDALAKTLSDLSGLPMFVVQSLQAVAIAAMVMWIGSVMIHQGAADWPVRKAKQASAPAVDRRLTLVGKDGARVSLPPIPLSEQVKSWYAQATAPCESFDDAQIKISDLYNSYRYYARYNQWIEVRRCIFEQALAQLCADGRLAMQRHDYRSNKNGIRYSGRILLNGDWMPREVKNMAQILELRRAG